MNKLSIPLLSLSLAFIGAGCGTATAVPATVATSHASPYHWSAAGGAITYVNEDVGIEFSYPQALGEPKTEFVDRDDPRWRDDFFKGTGRIYYVSFGNFGFNAATKDYNRPIEMPYSGAGPADGFCSKDKAAGNWPICVAHTYGTHAAVLAVTFDNAECSYGGLMARIRFQNEASSPYAGLEFTFTPKDASAQAGKYFSCADDKTMELFAPEALAQAKAIISGRGLSQRERPLQN